MERRRRWAIVGGAITLGVSALLGLSFAGYLVQAAHRFPREPFRQPTRLYAAPAVLAVGEPASAAAVVEVLRELGYREARRPDTAGPLPMGGFRRTGDRLAIRLRRFPDRHLGGRRGGGQTVVLELEGGKARRIVVDGLPASRVELEPALLASYLGAANEERRPVLLDDLSEETVRAVLAAEDDTFFLHPGLSPPAIARAAWANLQDRSIEQGGSTLTQQLVKNLYLSPDRNFVRKAHEAVLAVAVEVRYSKRQILEAYLNEIYWGSDGRVNLIGLGAAAWAYFGKDPAALSLPEAATLAGMIHAPANYSPLTHPEAARERRNWVLGRMAELDWLAPERAARLAALPVVASPAPAEPRRARWFADAMAEEARRRYGIDDLGEGGYVLFATLSWREQRRAEEAVAQTLPELERRWEGWEGWEGWERRRRSGPLQAALVSVDPRDGAILAYVGGRDYDESQFDRVRQARRQAGSAFKPVVYAAAFAEGAAHTTMVLRDTPIVVRYGAASWRPQNDDHRFRGPVTVRTALERSLNIPTVRLAMQVGLPRVAELARDMGLSASRLDPVPALALGACGVTPWELARVYATLAAGGLRPEIHGLAEVYDRFGEPVESDELPAPARVLEPQPAYLVTSLLEGVVERGTGASARLLGVLGAVAGKTGTTDGRRDSWFAGYSAGRTTVVWVGYDDNARTNLSGARAAVPLWSRFIREVRPPGGFRPVPVPPGITTVEIDPATGELASELCPTAIEEVFVAWQAPSQECRLHAPQTQWAWFDRAYADQGLYAPYGEDPGAAGETVDPGYGYGYGFGGVLEGAPLEGGLEPAGDENGLRRVLLWPPEEAEAELEQDEGFEEGDGEIRIRPRNPRPPLEPLPVEPTTAEPVVIEPKTAEPPAAAASPPR
jgi:penicillin-binding protein 1B